MGQPLIIQQWILYFPQCNFCLSLDPPCLVNAPHYDIIRVISSGLTKLLQRQRRHYAIFYSRQIALPIISKLMHHFGGLVL